MRCTVTHRGVPLVALDLESGETTVDLAPVTLLPGYRTVLAPLFRRVELDEENAENLARGWCMTEEALTELSLARADAVTVIVQLPESHAPDLAVERRGPRLKRGAALPGLNDVSTAQNSGRVQR